MGEIEVTGEPPIDELLSDPIMQMLLDTENMTIERLKTNLEETAERIFKDVA